MFLQICVRGLATRLLCGGFEFLPLGIAQRDVGGLQVLFEMFDGGRAGDWQHYRRAVEQPGERELRDGRSMLFRELIELAARLRALGPQGTLDRGYALVLDTKGHPVSRAKKTLEGQRVRIVLSKGTMEASLTVAQPEKTLMEALHPQEIAKEAVLTNKAKIRKKKP